MRASIFFAYTPRSRLVQGENLILPYLCGGFSGTLPRFAMHDFMSSESGSPKIDRGKEERKSNERKKKMERKKRRKKERGFSD